MELTYRIEGITPLLMHNPAGMSVPKTEAVARKSNPTREEDAEAGCYRLPSGQFYLPADAFRSCLLEAAKGRKIGKNFATSLVRGNVFTVAEHFPLFDPSTGEGLTEYEIDTRRVVVQKQGIPRSRPKLTKWAGQVIFDVDTEALTDEHVRALLTVGGRTVGVGDFRPQRSGPFGRFTVLD